jgi:deoxyribodipyrimidine photo-lyase
MSEWFPPTRAAALARIDAVDVSLYGRTRNHLTGAVSRLSPYLTHGLTDVVEVIARIRARARLTRQDKFMFELGWRAYSQHVFETLGEDIWQPQHAAPAPRYLNEMPSDVLMAETGVPAIDEAIRALYETGYVHNHARMWLASYLIHLRKVHWHTGADWMYRYLIDGDVAANTLSWQWVAGTWTGKPYLFNAENVARYGGADSSHTEIDHSYEALAARSIAAVPPLEPARLARGQRTPPTPPAPPPVLGVDCLDALLGEYGITRTHTTTSATSLVHPWALAMLGDVSRSSAVLWLHPEFHVRYPWSEARWRFVLQAARDVMPASARYVYIGVPAAAADVITSPHTGYAHAIAALAAKGTVRHQMRRAFTSPQRVKRSFSSWWHAVAEEPVADMQPFAIARGPL